MRLCIEEVALIAVGESLRLAQALSQEGVLLTKTAG